jgi:hypothetical protein
MINPHHHAYVLGRSWLCQTTLWTQHARVSKSFPFRCTRYYLHLGLTSQGASASAARAIPSAVSSVHQFLIHQIGDIDTVPRR